MKQAGLLGGLVATLLAGCSSTQTIRRSPSLPATMRRASSSFRASRSTWPPMTLPLRAPRPREHHHRQRTPARERVGQWRRYGAYNHDGTVNPSDAFSYTIRDTAGGDSNTATVAVTVTPFPAATSGLKSMVSGGDDRNYYLDLPDDYDPRGPLKPLIIGYHGTGGSYQRWLDYYRLNEVVGNGAILIYPDARPNAAGTKQWNFSDDFRMFEDLLDALPSQVRFDANRIFVTGQSSGGGFAHELGCRYGDRIRAIAPAAGSLTTSTCVGSVGVLQIQGEKDSYVPVSIGEIAHRYWVLYNGLDIATSVPGVLPVCVDHSLGRPRIRCSGACIRKATGRPRTPGPALPTRPSGPSSRG